MRSTRRNTLLAIVSALLLGAMSSCASWWSATFGPGGADVSVGGPIEVGGGPGPEGPPGGPGGPPPGGPGGPP